MKLQSLMKQHWMPYSIIPLALLVLFLTACGSSGSSSGGGITPPQPPQTITTVSPEASSDTALVTTTVSIQFGIDMDKASVEGFFTVREQGGADVTADTINYEVGNRIAIFTPASDLSSDVLYTATLSSSVLDATGTMPLTSDYVWSFSIAPTTVLVSTDANGIVGNNASTSSDIDAEGRYVVFVSAANLTSVATGGIPQVYRKDTQTGLMRMVSTDATGQTAADNACSDPVVNSTGRYVAFTSTAKNLSTLANLGIKQIYRKDMQTGEIEMVSRTSTLPITEGNNISEYPAISGNGNFVVFQSLAMNLDGGSGMNIYLSNLSSGAIQRVSRSSGGGNPDGDSGLPDVSDDGRYVVFQSKASNLGGCTTLGEDDIFVRDLGSQPPTTTCISTASGGGDANDISTNPTISGDGSTVLFTSIASDLVAVDGNGGIADIFMRDSAASTATELVSVTYSGGQADNASDYSSVSSNGRYVSFVSAATNLVPNDTEGVDDIFVRDLGDINAPNDIVRVSLKADGAEANAASRASRISDNGRYVSFGSDAILDDAADNNGVSDIYRAYNAGFPNTP